MDLRHLRQVCQPARRHPYSSARGERRPEEDNDALLILAADTMLSRQAVFEEMKVGELKEELMVRSASRMGANERCAPAAVAYIDCAGGC